MSHCHEVHAASAAAIQPRGWAILCDAQAATVTGYSANLGDLFPQRQGSLLGAALRDLVGSETSHAWRNAMSRASASPRSALLPSCKIGDCEGAYDCALHSAGEQTIIEIERASGPDFWAIDRVR